MYAYLARSIQSTDQNMKIRKDSRVKRDMVTEKTGGEGGGLRALSLVQATVRHPPVPGDAAWPVSVCHRGPNYRVGRRYPPALRAAMPHPRTVYPAADATSSHCLKETVHVLGNVKIINYKHILYVFKM